MQLDCNSWPGEDLRDDVPGLGDLIEPHKGVHFGHFAAQFLGKTLRHATADDQFLTRLPAHSTGFVRLKDRLDGFLLGRIDERASVHDQHIGVLGV